MKSLLSVFILSILISLVWGWVGFERTNNTVEHPGHCFSKSENVGAMEKGEEKTIKGQCVKVECGDDTTLNYYGCGAISPPENCTLSDYNLEKPYPDCCRGIKCP